MPGFCTAELPGDPVGNTHEYFAAAVVVENETDCPAVMGEAEAVIVPCGGVVV